jgi:acyl-CoA synthetase (NDP forming)/GNAT superfamily N-acetyltransferase
MNAPPAAQTAIDSVTSYPADVLLTDGRIAVIRPLRAEDEPALLALHDLASDDSIRFRFFTVNRRASHEYAEHLVSATNDVLTMVAIVDGALVAAASAELVAPGRAEAAFLVAEDAKGNGLGSLLLEHLAAVCHERGVSKLTALVMAENSRMIRVFADAGFPFARTADGSVVEFEIGTTSTPDAVRAADEREFQAEQRSLAPLLYPHSVAVVGVRRDGVGIGRAVLRAISKGGFDGGLYVVHPDLTDVDGVPCVTDIGAIPEPLDLVIIAVPASATVGVLRAAAEAHVRSAVVISSGFKELGAEGARLQRELVEVAREHSIRLVGPNCLGILSNGEDVRLNATFTEVVPPRGGLAIASQSGGVGIVMLDLARRLGLGIQSFISLGNKADVSGNDLLAAWYDDDQVTAAALYLESFGNARKFARVARRFAERKPLLAVVGGSSASGMRAGRSHTAAAAAPSIAVEALFAQAGVLACDSSESMARAALLLTQQPLPAGPRVGIISNAGGMGVLAADCADRLGLVVPEFSPELEARLRAHVQGTIGTSNPVDLGAGAGAQTVHSVVEDLLASGEVDALLVPLVATSLGDPIVLADAVARARAVAPAVPVVLVAMGGLQVEPGTLPGVTVFDSPDDAIAAMALAARRSAWLHQPNGQPEPEDEARGQAARDLARDALARLGAPDCWLPPELASAMLSPYGLASVGEVAHSPDEAAAKSTEIGFPVAVKVADPTILHKTDRGLVKVGLMDAVAVAEAVKGFEQELQREQVPVLIQPVSSGVEVALGVVRDDGFGPLVMVAAGGVATNLWKDRVFLLPPITKQDAGRALQSLRIWPLLEGYRGSPRADVDDLVQRVVELGRLAQDVPELSELDLNPVLATPTGSVVVDAKVGLSPSGVVDAGIPRRLRPRPTT